MSDVFKLRVSPSGPGVDDDSSGQTLLVGPGTPGLGYYATGDSSSPAASSEVSPGGLSSVPVTMTPGKSYVIEAHAAFNAISVDGSCVLFVQGQRVDNDAWETLNDETVTAGAAVLPVVAASASTASMARLIVARPTVEYDAIRVRVQAPGTAVVQSDCCSVKMWEIVK